MSKNRTKKNNRIKNAAMTVFIAAAVLLAVFFFYAENCYHADRTAKAMLRSDSYVTVTPTETGRLFDGPGTEALLIFYPGGKVEETAYAPLLRLLADGGMDVALVKMPLRLAVFGIGKAGEVGEAAAYDRVYLGGHSLGGAMAADYAAKHPEEPDGLLLLAAYSTKPLPDSLPVLSVYGSEDGVLNRENYEKNRSNLPNLQEVVIEGGNHAQFGSYGQQKGDGEAVILPEMQQGRTAEAILEFFGIERQ